MFYSFFRSLHLTVDEKVLFEFYPFQEVAFIVQKVLIRGFVPDYYEGCADNQSD